MNDILKDLWRAPATAQFGIVVVLAYVATALFAPWLAPYGETEIVGAQYLPASDKYPLGTDNLGRDMLSRVIHGARNTVGITLIATVLTFLIGVTMGFIAATFGGWIDQLFSRLVDTIMAIPILIFALMLLTVFGTSIPVLITVTAILESTRVYRVARAVGMNIVVMEYVEAARLRGEGLAWVMRREVLPNAMAPLIAEFGLRFCFVLLFISALSFLGLGIQPPTADWGSMVRANATLISFGDPTPLIPAGAIALLTVAVNFVVDWFLYKRSGLKE